MTNKTFTILVIAHWAVSGLFATIFLLLAVLERCRTAGVLKYFSFITLNIIKLVSFLVTYSYFYLRVKKIKSLESNAVNCPQNRQRLLFKKFKLPCYIVLTYIGLNMTSTIMLTYSRYTENKRLSEML